MLKIFKYVIGVVLIVVFYLVSVSVVVVKVLDLMLFVLGGEGWYWLFLEVDWVVLMVGVMIGLIFFNFDDSVVGWYG